MSEFDDKQSDFMAWECAQKWAEDQRVPVMVSHRKQEVFQ
jgi:hypothetical protein